MMNRKKLCKTLATIILVAGMIVGTATTAFAYVDPASGTIKTGTVTEAPVKEDAKTTSNTEKEANQTEVPKEETPTTADGSAFSVPGNGEIQDDVTDGSSKEFLTIRTANNNTFYVVIDRASTTENVYMLSTINEDDLQEFLTDSEKKSGTETADVVLDEQPAPTPPAVEKTKEDTTAKTSTNKGAMLGIIAVALCGLAGYYYFKIYKPKKEEEDDDNQDLELTDGLETINEEDIEMANLDDVEESEE